MSDDKQTDGESAVKNPASKLESSSMNDSENDPMPNSTAHIEVPSHEIPDIETENSEKTSEPEQCEEDTAPPVKARKPKKSVGFAPEPEEALREHHQERRERKKEDLKNSPFWKIPPELSYLEPKPQMPKPLPSLPNAKPASRPRKAVNIDDIPDLPSRAVKEIAVVNKKTALNFNFHEVVLPIGPDRLLVEVKYGALSSFDLSKIQEYALNVSYERVGLGYDFVGEIAAVGANYKSSTVFKKGTKVFGVTNPADKKGALQTCVILNPRDIVIPISDEDYEKMCSVDMTLPFDCASPFQIEEGIANSDVVKPDTKVEAEKPENSKKQTYQIEANVPDLAKFAIFGSQYCRAKSALNVMHEIFTKQGTANILINGADTNLGYTIMQLISSSVYKELESFNVTLVVHEKNVEAVKGLATSLGSGGSRKFNVVAYDMQNEELVLPGEVVPINYKKVPYFATEIIHSMFQIVPQSQKISKKNISSAKLDLFIDIVGGKKMFHKTLSMSKIDEANFPFRTRLENGVLPSMVFGTAKEPLFTKLMKSKSKGSSYISFCDFNLKEPSYSIDQMVRFKGSAFDPWASPWASGIANSLFSKYNYYEKFRLEIKQAWVEEAFELVKNGELRMNIDGTTDWRNDFRKQIANLRKHDGAIVFKVETF